MIRWQRAALALTAVLAVPPALPAQTLPSADALVARFVEAIGGRDAILGAPGYRVTGTLEIPAQGISGDFESFASPPNRVALTANIPGLGEVGGGFDGTVGWSVNPATGPMVLDGRMLDQMRQQADFYSALHSEDFVASMETVGEAEFEGVAAWKVKIVTTWGEEYLEFFDRESGLLIGAIRQAATPLGEIEATTLYQDYGDVDGVRIPMRIVQRMMGFDQVFETTSMERITVPDSVWVLPPAIQGLVRPN
jgi:hypothetical protein